MKITAQPEKTYAVVVGIEKYDAGPTWDLPGPASDACRFVTWLRGHSVPASNIFPFLSALGENPLLDPALAAEIQPATRDSIYKALTNKISKIAGDLLFLFWGGHGVMAEAELHRLFYADATSNSRLNLELNSLLVMLRSSQFAGLKQQVCMIDVCANFMKDSELALLPSGDFPRVSASIQHKQFVISAASRGEFAKNLSTEQTGLFSKVLLKHLTNSVWPPDFAELAEQLKSEFETLRAAGQTSQTPNLFQYSDWSGNVTRVTNLPTESPPSKKSSAGIPTAIYNQLRTALLECGVFNNDNQLAAIFAHAKLAPWRYSLPQASNPAERVETTMAFLAERYRAGTKENALVLFVRILSERIDPDDECHQRLADIADNLQRQPRGDT